jgi:hypothetical protein
MHPAIAAAVITEMSARRERAGREHRAARTLSRSPLAALRGALRRRRARPSPAVPARHAPVRAGR